MSTNPPGCDDVREDLDAYALGALDAGDSRRVDLHVAGCPDCRRLLHDARAISAELALSVPVASPGRAARTRILARAAAMETPAVLRRRPVNRWWLAAAAVLVVALAGASTWTAVTQRRIDNLEHDRDAARASAASHAGDLATARAQVADMSAANARIEAALADQRAMVDVMVQADAVHVGLHGSGTATSASAQYVWSPARNAGVMMADGLPQLAAGQTYQAWVVYETSWESVGTFSVDASGAGTLLVSGHDGAESGTTSWYCVTVEPAGGSARRTGPMVLSSLH